MSGNLDPPGERTIPAGTMGPAMAWLSPYPQWVYLACVALLLLAFLDAPWKLLRASRSAIQRGTFAQETPNTIASLVALAWLAGMALGLDVRVQDWPSILAWVPLIGALLAIAGTGLALWARIVLGAWFLPTAAVLPGHQLVRQGPFAHMRHPFYSGAWLVVTAAVLVFGSLTSLVAALLLAVLFPRIARLEEDLLLREFKEEYERYMQEVPRFRPRLGRV